MFSSRFIKCFGGTVLFNSVFGSSGATLAAITSTSDLLTPLAVSAPTTKVYGYKEDPILSTLSLCRHSTAAQANCCPL